MLNISPDLKDPNTLADIYLSGLAESRRGNRLAATGRLIGDSEMLTTGTMIEETGFALMDNTMILLQDLPKE